ncbi:hypothetical protein FRX31_019032 [Thalictrum thalictroides]|uniref:Uncharacterized protein n=1 Tax=Thalictrum thalictroides TaxID=46969 RepID=A0A7J6W2F4_THATH|nr:hypothetical protein FRX31_019032 [Thalictrum thalictroides]
MDDTIIEDKDLMDNYVTLEDESEECGVIEDVEMPIVVDDGYKEGLTSSELSACMRWTRNARDEAVSDITPCLESQVVSYKAKNSQYNVLFQEAIKCAEEGVASDHSFKVALACLREARRKIVDAKKNALSTSKLETVICACNQDGNQIFVSHLDSFHR